MHIVIGSVLLMEAIVDIKTHKIGKNRLMIYGILVASYQILHWKNLDYFELILGFVTGLLILAICYFSKEAIGYGDGFLITILGILLGGRQIAITLYLAMILLLFASAVQIVRSKFSYVKIKKERLAFFPFLFLGYIGGYLL